jgi:CRP/FNR family cyclic AMP-dependent transcriptional regulator
MGTLHLFRDLPEIRPFSAGEYIFRKGEAGDAMYMVIEGEVDLLVGRAVMETAKPGAFLGEMALILPATRTASARARTDCRVFPIDTTRFQSLVRDVPSFALDVMRALADRLRRANAHVASGRAGAGRRAPSRRRRATK